MTAEEALSSLEAWLEPASMGMTAAQLDAHRAGVMALSEQASTETLVLASFQQIAPTDQTVLEAIVSSADSMYPLGGIALLTRMSAAATNVLLDSAGDQSLQAALWIEGAEFSGLNPVLQELGRAADDAINSSAVRARDRSPKRAGMRQLAPDADEAAKLAFSNNVLKRVDSDYEELLQRLALMDEEIDFLWWARSDSTKSGSKWSDLEPLSRAIEAAQEVGGLIANVPSTATARALMAQRVDMDDSVSLKLSDLEVDYLPFGGSAASALRPIASIAQTYADFPDNADARTAILHKVGIDRKRKVSLRQVAQQLLVEHTIERLGHGNA